MGESLHYHSFIPFLDNHAFTIVLMMMLDYAIVIFILWLGSLKRDIRPKGAQNLVEWFIKYVTDYADSVIGKQAPRYYPILLMLFMYILVGNLMGLIPGLISPTSMLTVTVTLAVCVFIMEWFEGIRAKGIIKYLAHYTGGDTVPGPLKPFLFFVELMSDISRPVSLSFRLFGNIMAKEILLGVLIVLVILFWPTVNSNAISAMMAGFSFVLRPLIIVLGVLVSVIQAGVFTLLTAIYISGAVASHEHSEEH